MSNKKPEVKTVVSEGFLESLPAARAAEAASLKMHQEVYSGLGMFPLPHQLKDDSDSSTSAQPNQNLDSRLLPQKATVDGLSEQVQDSNRKYDNIMLPALQKGWGPFQALEELQRQGKIRMTPGEMKRESERIRDREFAKSGRNYFRVGETLSMYSDDEGKQKPHPKQAADRIQPGHAVKTGDSSPYRRSRGRPDRDGTIAQTYINQENINSEMHAVRRVETGKFGSMNLRGTPTISAEKIDTVLRQAGSPAAKERIRDTVTGKELTFGQHLYKLGIEYGIDPAITLAFFKAESGFGKRGVANRTNSLGNIKSGRGYREYGSFAEGARDWFKLIQYGKFYFKQGRDTVGKVIPKYAPRSDGNNESKYIRNVENDVRTWSLSSVHAPASQADRSRPYRDQTWDRAKPLQKSQPQMKNLTRDDSPKTDSRQPERGQPGERPKRSETTEQDELPKKVFPSDRAARPKPEDRSRPVIEVRAGESIQKAIDNAAEGAIIQVQPGIYRERLVINRNNITLKGDGRAIIDLNNTPIAGAAINISDKSNVTIDGFEIRNIRGSNTPTGIRVDGVSRDITISNNNIHHIENDKDAHGIGVFGNKRTPIKNLSITGNEVHNLKLGTSESVVINGNVEGFRIIGNKIHDNDNIGIDIIGYEKVGNGGTDRARSGLIANNLIYNIDSGKNPRYRGDRSAAGIYVDGGTDIIVDSNIVKNCNYGIELASEHRGRMTSRIQVRRNLVEDSHLAGVSLGGGRPSNGGVADSIIENNDLRKNSRRIWRQHNVASDVITRNNESKIEQ